MPNTPVVASPPIERPEPAAVPPVAVADPAPETPPTVDLAAVVLPPPPQLAPPPAEPGAPPPAEPDAPKSKVGATLRLERPGEDGWSAFTVELEIDDGWHIYPPQVTAGLGGPTTLEAEGLELRNLDFPRGVERRPVPGEPPLRVYEGRVAIRGELRRTADGARLVAGFQPCGEGRCLPPASHELELSD